MGFAHDGSAPAEVELGSISSGSSISISGDRHRFFRRLLARVRVRVRATVRVRVRVS